MEVGRTVVGGRRRSERPLSVGDRGQKDHCLETEVERTVVSKGGQNDRSRRATEVGKTVFWRRRQPRSEELYLVKEVERIVVSWWPGVNLAKVGGQAEVRHPSVAEWKFDGRRKSGDRRKFGDRRKSCDRRKFGNGL
ncbi:hypothetical protein M5K25_000279 [Dendrobium thyrsiflorum]|uniref:Uncharacterized protein n=1 Tax=Dendrobium thyrsiflorum TaxID=117978 RepID=A0ABD0W5X1_DENTH